jgi:hypothetical protein
MNDWSSIIRFPPPKPCFSCPSLSSIIRFPPPKPCFSDLSLSSLF